jgi:hypothetical protein
MRVRACETLLKGQYTTLCPRGFVGARIDRPITMDSSDAYDLANLGWDHKGQMLHSLVE